MTRASEASYTAAFIYAMFSIGIGRSWELLGMQRDRSLVAELRDTLTHTHLHPQAPPDRADPADPPSAS